MASGRLIIAFIGELKGRKILQKLLPLTRLDDVERIDVYRRAPCDFLMKVNRIKNLRISQHFKVVGELEKFVRKYATNTYEIIDVLNTNSRIEEPGTVIFTDIGGSTFYGICLRKQSSSMTDPMYYIIQAPCGS